VRVLVSGDREWTDRAAVERAFDRFKPTHVIEGECKGLDVMARDVAEARGIPVTQVPADWNAYGKAAGPMRNRKMLEMGPEMLLAFHNHFKRSVGTKDCVTQALKFGVESWLITSENTIRLAKRMAR
jgi:hypothetical protein